MSDGDEFDPSTARHYFRVRRNAIDEVLGRRVLALAGTGTDYGTLSRADRAALTQWCVALGSLPPPVNDWYDLVAVESSVRAASRRAASLTVELAGESMARSLTATLLPSAAGRAPVAVLSTLGFVVHNGLHRVVDDGEHDSAFSAAAWYGEIEEDDYSKLADRTPGTSDLEN